MENIHYPLPRIEYVFQNLEGGDKFSKIDLREAYQQVLLMDESSKLVTISTHKGLYKYSRLPYGIMLAPSYFQKLMETALVDLEGVVVFIDDILVTAPNDDIHIERLKMVFQRLLECGLRIKREKCQFFKNSVQYVGHVINKTGLHTTPERVNAIKIAKAPQNLT